MDQQKIDQLEFLAKRLDNCGVAEYVEYSRHPWKILWLNFLSGVARGLGFTLGTTLVLAVLYKVLTRIISMNIPYLTEMLKQFVSVIHTGG